jgi:flavodoxin
MKTVLIIVVVVVVLVGVGAGTFFYFLRRWDSEQPSKKDTLRPEVSKITGKALIVYHPGATGYTEEVAYAVGKALQAKGWQVHLDRANSRTISDLSEFNLLCLGSPTYSGSPRPPIVNYINRCSDMEDRLCLVFATGRYSYEGYNPGEANKKLQSLLKSKGGKVISSLALLTKQKDQVDELTEEFVEKMVKLIENST